MNRFSLIPRIRSTHNAFTLAELLLALAILAVIATFTIPKLLSNVNYSARDAVLKETSTMLMAVYYEGYRLGEITSNNDASYVLGHVNAIKICPTHCESEGCWDLTDSELTSTTCGGFVLANGAVVTGCSFNGPNASYKIGIDYNGEQGPNVVGEDQIEYLTCPDPTACNHFGWIAKPGTLVPNAWSRGNIDSSDLYLELFK